MVAATTPDYGDVVLAEFTQGFNEGDITYFEPLYLRTVAALGFFPTHTAADAAYDAWYVYQKSALHGGITANTVQISAIGLDLELTDAHKGLPYYTRRDMTCVARVRV